MDDGSATKWTIEDNFPNHAVWILRLYDLKTFSSVCILFRVSVSASFTLFDVTVCSRSGAGHDHPVGHCASSVELQPQPRLAAASSLIPVSQPAPAGAPFRVHVSKHVYAALQTTRVQPHLWPFCRTKMQLISLPGTANLIPAPPCVVLPPGEFNGTIPEPLPVYSDSFTTTAETDLPWR